jgi:hypothetical protein
MHLKFSVDVRLDDEELGYRLEQAIYDEVIRKCTMSVSKILDRDEEYLKLRKMAFERAMAKTRLELLNEDL